MWEGNREPFTEGSNVMVIVLVELVAGMKLHEPIR
jgi:hypothetical protein